MLSHAVLKSGQFPFEVPGFAALRGHNESYLTLLLPCLHLHWAAFERHRKKYILLAFSLVFFLFCLVINSTHWDLQLCFQFHLFLLNPTTLHFFSFLQAVYSGPGQLWDVQCGPAPHPSVQRGPPALLPRVAGEDLRAAWHQSGAEGHPREVSAASSCTSAPEGPFALQLELWITAASWPVTLHGRMCHQTPLTFGTWKRAQYKGVIRAFLQWMQCSPTHIE